MRNPPSTDEAHCTVPGDWLPPPLAYNVKQASAVSGLGRTTLYELLRTGKLQRVKVGARTLIRHDDLCAFLDGNTLSVPQS